MTCEVIRMVQARCLRASGTQRPRGSFEFGVARRHVDLLRVCSALCPGDSVLAL
jgi:hypothetical protein